MGHVAQPVVVLPALLVLTLGIGATLAIFSFVDAALIKPLPYREPARLVTIFGSIPLGGFKFALGSGDRVIILDDGNDQTAGRNVSSCAVYCSCGSELA